MSSLLPHCTDALVSSSRTNGDGGLCTEESNSHSGKQGSVHPGEDDIDTDDEIMVYENKILNTYNWGFQQTITIIHNNLSITLSSSNIYNIEYARLRTDSVTLQGISI